jgi:hypothetical protein
MPAIKHVVRALGLGILLVTAGACSTVDDEDPAVASTSSAEAPDAVLELDSDLGTADDPAPIEPGPYVIPFLGVPGDPPWGEVEVPAGWSQDQLTLATGTDQDPHLRRLELLGVNRVAQDPCQEALAPVSEDVDSIVAALVEQNVVRPTEAQPVTIDGYPGQVVGFQVPADLDLDNCRDGQSLRPFGFDVSYTSVFPGWSYRVWVLDVEGQPQAILAAHGPEATTGEVAELTTMVESLRFVEPADRFAR